LLLRADLHKLFDDGLITVDEELKIRIASSLQEYSELSQLDGSTLRIASNDPLLPILRDLLKQRKSTGSS
jgi:predicted restriction endonuclease